LFHIRYTAFFSFPFPCFLGHLPTTGIDSRSTSVTVNATSQDSFFHCTWDDMIKKKVSKIWNFNKFLQDLQGRREFKLTKWKQWTHRSQERIKFWANVHSYRKLYKAIEHSNKMLNYWLMLWDHQ
jgi:hypothetical protein